MSRNGNSANYAGRKVLVVGLGDTGAACVRWLLEHDATVRATDSRAEPPHAQHMREAFPEVPMRLGGFAADDFAWAEMVVVSPGVALATPEIRAARDAGKDIVGDVELFARAIRASRARVIAITGSNGKSTVTTLVGHLCAALGLDTVVAGNIGLPVLDALDNRETLGREPEVWVLELSSFQLETTSSLAPDAATVLNLSQDHMDRYDDMDAYAAAKAKVFGGKGEGGRGKGVAAGCIQVLNREDARVMAMALPGHTIWTFGIEHEPQATDAPHPSPFPLPPSPQSLSPSPGRFGLLTRKDRLWLAEGDEALLPVDKLPIAGLHNAANALAALALCRAIDLPYDGLLPALKTFEGLPHRVQRVAEVDGRVFYDDSKGTNVGATEAALRGMTMPVVLIAGGDGKGQDFTPLREAARQARAVVLIGRDAARIEAAIADACPVHRAADMDAAVALAYALSAPGDAVLLSPACASWDMFRDYTHRAAVFVAAVRRLARERDGEASGTGHPGAASIPPSPGSGHVS